MAACNPRKFKDRIALLNQKQQEGEAQFQAVMQEVSQVWKQNSNPGMYKGGPGVAQMMPHDGLGIPNHFSQGFQHPPHFSKYGGSLPNVNQLTATPPAEQVQVQETPDLGNTLPGLHQFQQGLCHSLPGSHHSNDHISGMEQQRSGQSSPRGSRAIRNRSGDQRWDTSPYRGDRHYSGSLSPYMSPSPQARWRRISSDSALYQSVKAPIQTDSLGSPGSDEQPISTSQEEVNKLQINLSGNQFNMKQTHPSPVKGGLYLVKEEAVCPETTNDNKHIIDLYQTQTKSPQSPSYTSPMSPSYGSPMSPSYIPTCSSPMSPSSPSLPAQNFQQPSDKSWHNQYQHNIEQDFLKFGLGNALDRGMGQKFGYSGGQLVIADQHQQMQHQGQPSPSSQTPAKIPQFIITDFSENQKPPDPNNRFSLKHQNNRQVGIFPFFEDSQTDENGLDSEFSVDQLRQDLEPIDDQMLAILTGTGVAEPDLEMEQHFKK